MIQKCRQFGFPGYELEDYVQYAIAFIRENEPPEGYFLGFSGGKDSIVMLELTKMSGVRFTGGYNSTGIDHPEVVRMIIKKYPEIKIITPRKSFWALLKKKPPTSTHYEMVLRDVKRKLDSGI